MTLLVARSHDAKFEPGNTDKYTFWRRFIKTLYIYCYLFYFRTFTTEIHRNIFVFFSERAVTHAHRAWCHSSSFWPWVLHDIITEPQMWQQKHVPCCSKFIANYIKDSLCLTSIITNIIIAVTASNLDLNLATSDRWLRVTRYSVYMMHTADELRAEQQCNTLL